MLVSVAVITYNSSNTIIETLNSILNQSYGSSNIELIISDDASTDNTVEVIDKWLDDYRGNFHNVIFIKNSVNLGVSSNINTAWKSVSSEWVKSIAGDDLLHISCIKLNVSYVKKNPDCRILFSKMQLFGASNYIYPDNETIKFFKYDSKDQYNWLRTHSFSLTPSSFINLNILKEVGYADEKYRMIEDLPLWLKITKSGHKFEFINKITVYYRVHESISYSEKNYINESMVQDLILIFSEHREGLLYNPFIELLILERILQYKLMLRISSLTNNTPGKTTKLSSMFMKIIRPAHLIRKIITLSRK